MSAMDNFIDSWYDEALASGQGFQSEAEKDAYFAEMGDPLDHPMFATSAEQFAKHPLGDAFRQLREEDKSTFELFTMYKEEGNEMMKTKRAKDYHHAIGSYEIAKGFLDQMDTEQKEREENNGKSDVKTASEDQVDEGEVQDVKKLRSQLLSNMAAAHLGLKNYGTCQKASELALLYWNGNMKAHYRKCKAMYHLKKYEPLLAAYNNLVAYVTTFNAERGEEKELVIPSDLHALRKDSEACLDKLKEVEKKKNKRLLLKKKAWKNVYSICTSNNILLGRPTNIRNDESNGMQLTHHHPYYEEDTDTEINTSSSSNNNNNNNNSGPSKTPLVLKWPIVFMYPQYNKLDVIQGARSEDMLAVHLAMMFPEFEDLDSKGGVQRSVDWDVHGEYQVSQLSLYVVHQLIEDSKGQDKGEQGVIASEDEWVALFDQVDHRDQEEKQHTSSYKEEVLYTEIHIGCTVLQTLQCPRYIVPGGILQVLVYPTQSQAHKDFKNKHTQIPLLRPDGSLVQS